MGINTRKMKYPAAICVLLACCITMDIASYAAGWAEENGTWRYSGQSGDYITNSWIRHGNSYYYLDEKGEMATECLIKTDGDLYYVDINGVKAVNQWVSISDDNSQVGTQAATAWYYFGSKGKAYRNIRKRIDGKYYIFDENGHMLSGWQPYGNNDNLYYLGSDGAMKTGWRYLEPPYDEDEDDYTYGPESDDGQYWYYFAPSGKKYCTSTGDEEGEYRVSRIDGKYYCFDSTGKMQTGWVYMDGDPDSASSNTIEHWRYFAEPEIKNAKVGAAITGWLSLEPPERLLDNVDESVEWYYFNKDGEPKTGPEFGEASTDDFVRIDGKNYLFDKRGNPVKGLHKVEIGDTGEYTSYYFDEDSRTVVKGKRTIEEGDGTRSTFYFNEGSYAGRGFTGVRSNYLYYMGKLQKADSDSRYMLVSLPSGGQYKTYVVNTSGRISKNTTVKDRDGNRYKVNSSGILTEINGEAAGNGLLGDPMEPVYEEFD